MNSIYQTVQFPRAAIILGFVLLCSCILSGCDDTAPLPRLSEQAVILAFGDSLTFGTGAKTGESYPARLQQLIGRKVINAGIPGEISSKGLQRLPRLLDRYQPELLILSHGGNDIVHRMSRAAMKQNLRQMILLAKNRDIAIALIAVPEFSLFLQPADDYAELAEEFDLPLERDTLSDILKNSRLKADQVHPNSEGYQLLAIAIQQLLVNHGAF
jgi:lysophospholipase L1-like esterase